MLSHRDSSRPPVPAAILWQSIAAAFLCALVGLCVAWAAGIGLIETMSVALGGVAVTGLLSLVVKQRRKGGARNSVGDAFARWGKSLDELSRAGRGWPMDPGG